MAKERNPGASGRAAGWQPTRWQATGVLTVLALLFFKDQLFNTAYLWEDFLYYSTPVRSFAATTLARGEFPFWNPYTFNGMPFFADIQTMVLYLPTLFLTLFAGGGSLNPYWLQLLVILHVALAGVTMYFLARSFGLRGVSPLFAGLTFMLSGFMILHAIHVQIIMMVAWFPLILLLFRRTLLEATWTPVFLGAAVLGHSVLAGFPQLSLYLYFFLFIVFLFELLTTFSGRMLVSRAAGLMALRAALFVGLSIGLTAVQLLPTMELSELSQRAAITYEKSTEGQMSWSNLISFLFPKTFGVADATAYRYWGPGTYWYYWETCIYRGALPLLLTVLSALLWKKNKYIPFFLFFSAFGLLFALGDHFFLHRLFYDFVPGFATFRSPARMLIFMSMAVALLSAFALDHMLHAVQPSRTWRRLLIGTTGISAIIWLLLVSGSLQGSPGFPADPAVADFVRSEATLSLALILLSAAAIFALLARSPWMRTWPVLLVALTFIDLLAFGGAQNDAKNNPAEYFRRSEGIVRYIRSSGGNELFRVNARNESGMIMDRNQGMIDRIFMMEGYTPLALQRVYPPLRSPERMLDLLNVRFMTVTDTVRRALSLQPRPATLPRARIVYSLHVRPDERELVEFINSDAFDHRTSAVVEKDPGLPPVPPDATPAGTAVISSYGSNAITVDVTTSHDGLLVLSEMFFPGWTATLDGRTVEIYRTDYNLRGVAVPAGRHRVEFHYLPGAFPAGAVISLASLAVCGTGILLPLLRRRRKEAT